MTDLNRRTFVNAAMSLALPGIPVGCSLEGRTTGNAVSVPDFRLPQDIDDTAAFRRAIATRRPVYVPGRAGRGVGGDYLVGELELVAGVDIFGDGIGKTILRPAGRNAIFHCDSGSASTRITGMTFSDLTLEGWVVKQGFAEHRHLMHLNGVEDVLVKNVQFRGFQGDGLYLGSSRQFDTVRHNRGVVVRQCIFDGVNNDNRNGISIIDGENIVIEECIFKNCTRTNMPGAIDFEPDETRAAVIRSIVIRRCEFFNTGGNVGVIAFHIPSQVIRIPDDILISDNRFHGYKGTGAEIYFNVNRRLSAQSPSMDIVISGNRGSGGEWVYTFYSAKGISAIDNVWERYRQGAMIGYTAPIQQARNMKLSDIFFECGQVNGVGIYIFNVSRMVFEGCVFIDCGSGNNTSYAICFSRGKSEYVSLTGVKVRAPGRKTYAAVISDQLHRLLPSTNVQHSNDFGGLPGIDISKPL